MLTFRVPATIANLGPGFDSFGMAITLYNTFTYTESVKDTLRFSSDADIDVQSLQQNEPAQHLIFRAFDVLFEAAGKQRPSMDIHAIANIPVARGLGSSSTAIVASLMAANTMLGERFSKETLLRHAIAMEGHPDNVAPALLGGVVLYDTQAYSLPWPLEWRIITLSPSEALLTEKARSVLPKEVSLEDSVFNLRKASVLTYALLREDPEALRLSLHDRLHQPYRGSLIPQYEPLAEWAGNSGALGFIISGSGSSMAIFYPSVIHQSLRQSLQAFIQSKGWSMLLHEVGVDTLGALAAP
jgi:homoserine kinase